MIDSAAKLLTLADAVFETIPLDNHHELRPPGQKCILFHLLAYEGEPVSARVIAERSGMSQATISQCIKHFIGRGLLFAHYTPECRNKRRIIRFDWMMLARMAAAGPLVKRDGHEARPRKARQLLEAVA